MKICFETSGLPFHGNSIAECALGGSESAMIFIAKSLSKLGHEVDVFCECQTPGLYDNVKYHNLDDILIIEEDTYDVLVLSRFLQLLPKTKIAKKIVFWMHDVWVDDYSKFNHLADKIFLLSKYHKSLWDAKQSLDTITLTTNGFDINLLPISQPFSNKKDHYVYASRPERGLLYILNDIWYEVLKFNPNAILHICGYRNDTMSQKLKPLYEVINELVESTPNIIIEGELTKPKYYELLSKCGYMLYPTDFKEISCINAIEAQANRCLVITSNSFALSETVKSDTKINGMPEDDNYLRSFIDLVKQSQDEHFYTEQTEKAFVSVSSSYTWDYIAKQWEDEFRRMM